MKKFLSLVLALVMTMSLVTVSAGAKDFSDSTKIQYKEAVDVMSAVNVISGYAEGDFRPTATLTRGAAAKIICNLILGPTTAGALVADAAPYKDVPTNNTFAGYIAYCQKAGIISGYADGTFKPANSLTGYAFMKMLLGALGYDASREGYTGPNWSIAVGKRALNAGLADDLVGDFNGVKAVTREEACLYAFNMLQADMVEYEKNSTVIVGNITIKDTSLLSAISSTDLCFVHQSVVGALYTSFESAAIVMVIYLTMTLFASYLLRLWEKALDGPQNYDLNTTDSLAYTSGMYNAPDPNHESQNLDMKGGAAHV